MLRRCFLALLLTLPPAFAAGASIPEQIVLSPHAGSTSEDHAIAEAQRLAATPAANADAFLQLGWAFVAKARRTLDVGYFTLALKSVEAADARFGPSADSRLLRGHALHNLHQFQEAAEIAEKLVADRGDPADLALLSDALVELGEWSSAIEILQRLVDLKPGAESYSRIGHLRWLHGDVPGAVTAYRLAERAVTAPEARAWMLTRLSGLYLQSGDTHRALVVADAALEGCPEYPPSLLARGRALIARGEIEAASRALHRAVELNPLPEYQWWLAEALELAGDPPAAQAIHQELRRSGASNDPRTLALFLATQKEDLSQALELAQAELAERRDVFTHDAVAWALARLGNFPAADAAFAPVRAAPTQDARLFWHAGEIALGCGRAAEAAEFFARAQPLSHTLTPSERKQLAGRLAAAAALTSRAVSRLE